MTFEQALRAAGLHPRDVVADGRIHRCDTEAKPGRRNGWWVLHPEGHGAWGDWGSGGGEALGHWRDEHASVNTVAAARMAERTKQQRERDRMDRLEATRGARRFWQNCFPLNRPHPYIHRKNLTPLGCAGLRTHDDLLVVPVMLDGWLISVQTITLQGEKRFWPGAATKAGAFVLTRPRAAVTCIVEGLATGLAIFQSVPQANVIVAFNAGNLLPVVQRIKPSGSVVICADNDHRTLALRGSNPGLDKARNAAELIGCGVASPDGIEGSDWADYLYEHGEGAGKRVQRAVLAQARYVMA